MKGNKTCDQELGVHQAQWTFMSQHCTVSAKKTSPIHRKAASLHEDVRILGKELPPIILVNLEKAIHRWIQISVQVHGDNILHRGILV